MLFLCKCNDFNTHGVFGRHTLFLGKEGEMPRPSLPSCSSGTGLFLIPRAFLGTEPIELLRLPALPHQHVLWPDLEIIYRRQCVARKNSAPLDCGVVCAPRQNVPAR